MDVLLVSPIASDSDPLTGVLAAAQASTMRVRRALDLSEAVESLRASTFDAVLLDLEATVRQGLGAFVRLRAEAPALPIVVLANREHEALALKAVQLGAQDYLLKPEVHVTLLTRCVRHAVEQFRLLDELERRARVWDDARGEAATDDPAAQVTARMYGSAPLRELVPDAFGELVGTYIAILTDAVEERGYRVSHRIPERLRGMAAELGFLRAGPRDVVEMHTDALRTKAAEMSPRSFEAYVAEGRLMIVELMGNLVTFYRRYSVAPRPALSFGSTSPRSSAPREHGA
jgi:DNA-binding NarL/FixJ family response regulator